MRTMRGGITVEAAVIVPLFIGIFSLLIHLLFYFHDKNVVAAVAHETLVMMGETEEATEEEVENYFYKRIKGKCLLFHNPRAEVTVEKENIKCKVQKKRFAFNIELQMERTEPEAYIRKQKHLEEVGEEIKDKIEGERSEKE